MSFAGDAGLGMPVYYPPPGSPVRQAARLRRHGRRRTRFRRRGPRRVAALRQHWGAAPGFTGYLIGHEDYRARYYEALGNMVRILGQEDPGARRSASATSTTSPRSAASSTPCSPKAGPPTSSSTSTTSSATRCPPREGSCRNGSTPWWPVTGAWPATCRTGTGAGTPSSRCTAKPAGSAPAAPTTASRPPARSPVQVGLACPGGLRASSTSSTAPLGVDPGQRRPPGAGALLRGIVDRDGAPTATYEAVKKLNGQLAGLGPHLRDLHFHGGWEARALPDNELVSDSDPGLELGLFGDGTAAPTCWSSTGAATAAARSG